VGAKCYTRLEGQQLEGSRFDSEEHGVVNTELPEQTQHLLLLGNAMVLLPLSDLSPPPPLHSLNTHRDGHGVSGPNLLNLPLTGIRHWHRVCDAVPGWSAWLGVLPCTLFFIQTFSFFFGGSTFTCNATWKTPPKRRPRPFPGSRPLSPALVLGIRDNHPGTMAITGATVYVTPDDSDVNPTHVRRSLRSVLQDPHTLDVFLWALVHLKEEDHTSDTSFFQLARVHGLPIEEWAGVPGGFLSIVANQGDTQWCAHGSPSFRQVGSRPGTTRLVGCLNTASSLGNSCMTHTAVPIMMFKFIPAVLG
jgi:hypothetical protein